MIFLVCMPSSPKESISPWSSCSFGVLSLGDTPVGEGGEVPFLKGVEQFLSFSSVTPSPVLGPGQSQQQEYSRLLLSAPAKVVCVCVCVCVQWTPSNLNPRNGVIPLIRTL